MKRQKPPKPYPDFPLYAHSNGQWCKKVGQKFVYFGSWDDPQGALAKWQKEQDYHRAGLKPPTAELTVRELGNAYFTSRLYAVSSGELAQRTFDEYKTYFQVAVDLFGPLTASKLTPDHFTLLKAEGAKRGKQVSKNVVRRVKMVFQWGFDQGKLAELPRYGKEFTKRSKRQSQVSEVENSEKMFEAHEIRALIENANWCLKPMILLGINCGYGQNDIATLEFDKIQDGFITHPRPKTGTRRRCPLWPETIEALNVAIQKRYQPKSKENANLVFITKRKNRFCRYEGEVWHDGVRQVFEDLTTKLGIRRKGVGFYSLRRTFRTIADEAQDESAINLIMGHISGKMGARYTQRIRDDRLRSVTDYVHDWVWPKDESLDKKTR